MKSLNSLVILTIALVATLGTAGAATERFPWLTDLNEARELATSKELPMLIVFRCEP